MIIEGQHDGEDEAAYWCREGEATSMLPQLQKGDVFMVGAGFTAALTDSAPTMKGFLEFAFENKAYLPDERHRELGAALEVFFGQRKGTGVNVEEAATFLNESPDDSMGFVVDRSIAYAQLLEVISWTLNGAWQGAKQSPQFNVAIAVARRCTELSIPIITLNYDLVFDNLLLETERWNPFHGYGYGVHLPDASIAILSGYANAKIAEVTHIPEDTATVLLKLHGSLNWGIRSVPHPDGSHPVELADSIRSRYSVPKTVRDRMDPDVFAIRPVMSGSIGGGPPGVPGFRFEPLIIPPVSQKAEYLGNPLIRYTWYHAREALRQARRVVVLGYSLPPSDFPVRNLLRDGIALHRLFGDRHVTFQVVNPDRTVVERVAELCNPFPLASTIHLSDNCSEWLKLASVVDPP